MKRIITFTIILMALAACTAPQADMPILPRSIASRMGINLRFKQLPMAAKTEYAFFQMAAPVTSEPITGEGTRPPRLA